MTGPRLWFGIFSWMNLATLVITLNWEIYIHPNYGHFDRNTCFETKKHISFLDAQAFKQSTTGGFPAIREFVRYGIFTFLSETTVRPGTSFPRRKCFRAPTEKAPASNLR